MEDKDTIVVFTARSTETILEEGGSQHWVLNPVRAKRHKWLVCTQNRNFPDYEFSDGTEPHGSGFLMGKISGISPSDEERWLIEISEYARINRPMLWDGGRNPVRYCSLSDLGIRPNSLEFHPMPQVQRLKEEKTVMLLPETNDLPLSEEHSDSSFSVKSNGGDLEYRMSISDAKKALAATFGVKPEAIEITIRG